LLFSFCFNLTCFSSEKVKINYNSINKVEIPLTIEKGLPFVTIKREGQNFKLLFDTGANQETIRLTLSSVKKINVEYITEKSRIVDPMGNKYIERQFLVPRMNLGDIEFRDIIASEESRDFPFDGVLGNKILECFFVLIDYQSSRVVFYSKDFYPQDLFLDKWDKITFEYDEGDIIFTGKFDQNGEELTFLLDSGMRAIDDNGTYGFFRGSTYIEKRLTETNPFRKDHLFIDGFDIGPMDFKIKNYVFPLVDGVLGYNSHQDTNYS